MHQDHRTFLDTAAVFIVTDMKRSVHWYRDKLGFDVPEPDWSAKPGFCIAQAEGAAIMLRLGEKPGSFNRDLVPGLDLWDAYIWVRDIDVIHRDLQKRGTAIHDGPTLKPHGCTELRVLDPDGYMLGFGYCP
ncbi:VOC family protein [Parvularcula sp. IMCC14364]|uniref:VOC family protein n=1 Tax=Parvularcula sp. IMCC14364 TaxID=3067902 RepID=UPI0027409B3B|nr:VOC family protein [Parvularcula sp. IMCC14364]